ncbi:sulfur relay protein TusB/DsrH [Arsukibacterium tuosuense]|uniref:Sulfur relay protein TusB/DsrH n=1 Tax=Arsukibacterium tuosuense TaxID=1323745 RepID=A0A285I654_9GAMM|nr:DsrH/TusB family sulfur metabolism protein [Arsukibacterium tuosuense]SNY42431.1 sulfur relay protein TusB/DsrH [Arsukibacterium tuosuense]
MKLINLTSPAFNFAELALLCEQADVLLLRQDAVYLAGRNDIHWPCNNILALKSDLEVRQLTPIAGISAISDAEWVELTATASQVMLWR